MSKKIAAVFVCFCLAGISGMVFGGDIPSAWWPKQKAPKAIVKAVDYEENVPDSNGKSNLISNCPTHMLVESVAGLAAGAVNEGRGDEMVWIDDQRADYALWYEKTVKRLNPEIRGSFTPWQLVERYRDKGIIKGYVLYSYDCSNDADLKRQKFDCSANIATTAAGLMGGILIEEGQQQKAKELGLKLLFDARGKDPNQFFEQYKDRLNRNVLLTMNPKMPNNRDVAIAHKCMVVYGTGAGLQRVLEWLNPLSLILGWNCGDEGTHTAPVSSWGHFQSASDWAMNLPLLSAGSVDYNPADIKTLNPSSIDYNETGTFAGFAISDGDNVQWLMSGHLQSPYYWANKYNSQLPLGWSMCTAHLTQACPGAIDYVSQTQQDNATVLEFGGGYYYPDTFAENRPDRYGLLAEHARRISAQMKKNGARALIFICKDVNSQNAKKAYEVYAKNIDGLVGMVALQYYPYNGGDGAVYWVKNSSGVEIPVVTAKYAVWEGAYWPGGGSHADIAKLLNETASKNTAGNSTYNLVAVHSWSKFVVKDGQTEVNEPGVTPVMVAARELKKDIKVINPEEIMWRLRMQHNKNETQQEIKKITSNLKTNGIMKSNNEITDIYLTSMATSPVNEQIILTTLAGLTANDKKVIWIDCGGGFVEWFLKQHKAQGVKIHKVDSVWDLLVIFKPMVKGYVLYKYDNGSANSATSLCGPMRAIAVDESLLTRLQGFNFKKLADVRDMNEMAVFKKYNKLFSGTAMAEVPADRPHLRDFIVANNLFVFWDPGDTNRKTYLKKLKPNSLVYGFGHYELSWVDDLSKAQTSGIPADWSLNLPAMSRLKMGIPNRPHQYPEPVKEGERIVCFVMSDGDNIQWLAHNFANTPFYWGSPYRGSFNMTWEMAPALIDLSPGMLNYFYSNAKAKDDFVVGSSGIGYCFPNHLPNIKSFARLTANYMKKTQLSIVSILNEGGDMSQSKEFLDCPETLGVLYKDYHPYNKQGGKLYWYKGKPAASYKYLLWDNADENRPEGLAKSIAAMPSSPAKDPNSYVLINIHAWSFAGIGGPMEAVKRTIDLLPANTRVVTAEQYMILLRNNFGAPVPKSKLK